MRSDTVNNKSSVREKVSWFTGFHLNVGKTFVAFTPIIWIVLKKAIAQLKIHWESFCGSSKSVETTKLWSLTVRYVVTFAIIMIH